MNAKSAIFVPVISYISAVKYPVDGWVTTHSRVGSMMFFLPLLFLSGCPMAVYKV